MNAGGKVALQFLKYFVKKLIIKYMILMKSGNKHKGWCEDQDKIIGELVPKYGTKNWAQIADELHQVYGYSKKTGKQCRQRWHNHLNPSITKNSWTRAEEDILFQQHKKHGNKWTVIADKLPGRTDNSIKNHFYSTVRKSLRRISKFMGSKNSTTKMRQIKPSTLSKIFKIAEKTHEQSSSSNQENDLTNYTQIAQSLMDFARWKLADRKYVISQEDIKNFQKILQQMTKINNIYEDQRMVEAKIKKERLLQKNFDKAASSESEEQSSNQPQEIDEEHEFESEQKQKLPGHESITTRSKRKVKPPLQFKIQFGEKKQKKKECPIQYQELKQFDIKEEEESINVVMRSFVIENLEKVKQNQAYGEMEEFTQKENEPHPNQAGNGKFQFLVELEVQDESLRELQLSGSPGLKNTPMALTPKTYQFMRELPHQPIKNQDCNSTVNKIAHDIRRNTSHEMEAPQRPFLILSPLSAFKQYS